MHQAITLLVLLALSAISARAADNIVVNGTFTDSTGWNSLGVYGEAQATGSRSNNTYAIAILSAGNEVWSIQFTQSNIALDSGALYTFSFAAAASKERTIEASISMDGGDYMSYSGRDTLELTTEKQNFLRTFKMRFPADTSARLEFNCGKFPGDVILSNIVIAPVPGPLLQIITPIEQQKILEGVPIAITWLSVGITDAISIELSTDNGTIWHPIAPSVSAGSERYLWTPATPYSSWCKIRIVASTDSTLSSTTMGTFEIVPKRELISNGTFSDSASEWTFGLYGGQATGTVVGGVYVLAIDSNAAEKWQIQLIQSNIVLVQNNSYTLSFTASADSATTLFLTLGKDNEPYEPYFDTTQSTISLTKTAQQFTFEFTMNSPSDSTTRLGFDCGLTGTTIYLDNISITPTYQIAVTKEKVTGLKSAQSAQSHSFRHIVLTPARHKPFSGNQHQTFDLLGRFLPPVIITRNQRNGYSIKKTGPCAAGLYLAKPIRKQNNLTD